MKRRFVIKDLTPNTRKLTQGNLQKLRRNLWVVYNAKIIQTYFVGKTAHCTGKENAKTIYEWQLLKQKYTKKGRKQKFRKAYTNTTNYIRTKNIIRPRNLRLRVDGVLSPSTLNTWMTL